MKLNKDILLQWHTIFNNNQGSFITTVNESKLGNHPLVIFYNEYNKRVYYLKGQTFKNQGFYNKNEPYFYKIEAKTIKQSFQPTPNSKEPFVYNDTLFDTSTIYQMELEEFIERFELSERYSYSKINPEDQHNILKNLYFNFKDGDIAHKIVNTTITTVNNEQEVISKSYYSYVSSKYLIRNLRYEKEPINSFDLESLIKEFNLDVRKQPLSYNTIDEIISNAFYDFKINYPEFAKEISDFFKNERKKEKEKERSR